jgi:transposase InsO family protein
MLEQVAAKGLSQRAACRYTGLSRAVCRYVLRRPAQEAQVLEKMRTASRANPRYGYRRVAIESGIGFGRCWRLWKRHNFKIGAQRRRKAHKKEQTAPPRPQQAEYPDHVWTYDILFDRLADGRPFKTLSVLDEFTRECQGILVATSILAEDVIAFLEATMKTRKPAFLRSDNGSEFTAEAVQAWLAEKHVGPALIPPGQPWKNGFIESFHDKFRDECLQREWFSSLLDAQVAIEEWRLHYNTRRPHSSLGYKTPAAFAAQYATQFQPALTLIPDGHKN